MRLTKQEQLVLGIVIAPVVDRLGGQDVSDGASPGGDADGKTIKACSVSFEEVLEQILAKDKRYQRDAYMFVREALDYTQKNMGKASKGVRHVSGQQLLAGIRDYGAATIRADGDDGVRGMGHPVVQGLWRDGFHDGGAQAACEDREGYAGGFRERV